MKTTVITSVLLAALTWSETPAFAAPPDGNIPFVAGLSVIGALGGVTTSIAAIVFSVKDRPFNDGWATAALISAGCAGGLAGSFGYRLTQSDSDVGSLIAFFFFTAITVWPTYFTVSGLLTEVQPEPPLDPDGGPRTLIDPIDSLDPRPAQQGFTVSALQFHF